MQAIHCQAAEVRDLLDRLIASRFAMDDLLAGAICIKLIDEKGRMVGAYALADEGTVLWIRAAAGNAPLDLSDVLDQVLCKQGRANQFERLGFQTKRPGGVRKALRRGWIITGQKDGFTQMEKEL